LAAAALGVAVRAGESIVIDLEGVGDQTRSL
jgi:hypothetical protein